MQKQILYKNLKIITLGILIMCMLTACTGKVKDEESELQPDNEKEAVFFPNETISVEHPEEVNIADLVQGKAAGTMVQLRAGNMSGSGVILRLDKESMLVVTAGHVVQGADQAEVIFVDGSSAQCKDITSADSSDAAYLRLATSLLPENALAGCSYAAVDKASYDELKTGDEIIVMGSVDGVAANAYEGEIVEPWIYIEDFGQYMMLGKTTAAPGMSGGGVFDRQGCFIGILCGEAEEAQGENYREIAILPLHIILSEGGI